MEEEKRIRQLTEKGMELLESKISECHKKLGSCEKRIDTHLDNISVNQRDNSVLKQIQKELQSNCDRYSELAKEFEELLKRNITEETLDILSSLEEKSTIVREKVHIALDNIMSLIKENEVKPKTEDGKVEKKSHASRHRGGLEESSLSSVNSILLKKKVQAEAAKARLLYAEKEAKLKREQAELTISLEVLAQEKALAEAEAELSAVQEVLENTPSVHLSMPELPKRDSQQFTKQYVEEHADYFSSAVNYQPATDVVKTEDTRAIHDNAVYNDRSLNANAREFKPMVHQYGQDIVATELKSFLLRKDLLFLKLTNFNDDPSSYQTWKSGFKDVVNEMQASPREELDLLVKWLGTDSSRHAIRLRDAYANNPHNGLVHLWNRLNERFGSPEMVETSVRNKLAKFGKINYREYKKLFDLSDILCEINSLKEDSRYRSALAYFDSSSGINSIVQRLPSNIQGKWIDRASQYKRIHHVSFPPFTFFMEFVQDISITLNDPSLNFEVATQSVRPNVDKDVGHQKFKSFVTTRKTEVGSQTFVASEPRTTDTRSVPNCPLHNAYHTLSKCRLFKTLPINDRKETLKNHHVCFRCCESSDHVAKNCTRRVQCSECRSYRHCSAMHEDRGKMHGGEPSPDVSAKCSVVCGHGFKGKSCAKAVLVRVYPRGYPERQVIAYAIIDDQSNKTLARTVLLDTMGVDSEEAKYYLSSCNGVMLTHGRKVDGLVVETLDGETSFDLPTVMECDSIPEIKEEIPSPDVARHHPHLRHLASHISTVSSESRILLLIGRDLPEAHHVLNQVTGEKGTPFAQRLPLGWVIIGDVCLGEVHSPQSINVNKTSILPSGRPSFLSPCPNKFRVNENFSVEDLCRDHCEDKIGSSVFVKTKEDEKVGSSVEDRLFLQLMQDGFTKDEKGNWTAPLPFKPGRQRLPNNRSQALKRAKMLDINLKKHPQKKQHFVDFMSEIFKKGHAEIAPPVSPSEECWYLPIFGVYHPKKPTQIRGVFDSSAVFGGVSLNQVLMTGPDLTNNLVGVLLRFRREPVAVTADIQKMFYSFFVKDEHRNFLRFFWYDSNDPNADIVEYRMCVHVFGNSPSPAVATYGLRKTVENSDGDVKTFVERNFYVDDALASETKSTQAVSLVKRTQEILQTGGHLRLHKIASNSKEVMSSFSQEDLTKDLTNINIFKELLPLQHSLGLGWDLNMDTFTFKFESVQFKKPFTRRGLLSTINSLFDPLGFLAPITVQGKIILRDLSSKGADWDEQLPHERQSEWNSWKQLLENLSDLNIPRTYVPVSSLQTAERQILVYSDASEKAIAAVAFLKVQDLIGNSHIGFIMGKSKVAPSHGNTIPRLELCAAVLSVELAEFLHQHLDLEIAETKFHTDSRVVLGYIRNQTRRFYTYVSNRVEKIRKFSSPEQWNYIRTDLNPADVGTRGLLTSDLLHSAWLCGPSSSCAANANSIDENYPLLEPELDKEVRPEICALKTKVVDNDVSVGVHRFEKFSTWKKLVQAITFLKRFVRQRKCDMKLSNSEQVRVKSEILILKEVQLASYSTEILCIKAGKCVPRRSSIIDLKPFLDNNGLLRVGGRLRNSALSMGETNPIIIPGKSHVAKLLVLYCHETVKHQGRHLTEGAVRGNGYWITGARRLVTNLLHQCVRCRKLRRSVETQLMADLPSDRLSSGAPFTAVGVDTFGPWTVVSRKTRGGHANSKRWAILFTCLSTRGVHIEVIEELSSSSFINALRRFTSLRGKVKLFRSDRGTNFVGATDQLNIRAINVEDEPVNNFLHNNQCVWIFNTPHSSHMGGVWERLIGVARKILDSLLANISARCLTHEVLTTFMCEVTAIMNSRPITPVSTDIECPSVLSPSMLLTQKSDLIDSPPGEFELPDMYKAQWRRVQFLAETFWKRWRKEYLHHLQSRRKWKSTRQNVKSGDIVLLKDDTVVRNDWPMGRVINTFPSDDGVVRKVQVRILKNDKFVTFVRPVTQIILLIGE